MLLCLLWYGNYQYGERRIGSLIISGAAAGLSWLTKSPALFLAPFVGLLALADLLQSRTGIKSLRLLDLWLFACPLLAWAGIAAALVLLQALGLVQSHPHYYTYFNPLLGGLKGAGDVMMLGWGEGLEEAATYLNSLPSAGRLRVAAWYGDVFAYFFRGVTVGMDDGTSLAEIQNTDYAVLYVQQVQRRVPSPEVLEYFARLTPEYTVLINGVEYAWVYKLSGAPSN